jgi:uncharacterized protein YbjT (DUF2867 family)
MKDIIIAGSTGYLGRHLIGALQTKNLPFRAITRNTQKLLDAGLPLSRIITAQVTQPETLRGQLEGSEILISTVGITRQKDGLTYLDVDYQANLNLLREAQRAGIRKMIYVSAINGQHLRHLKIMEAKERFVDALISSGLDYIIIRPNGFFSDMSDFLAMAKKGTVYLFGHGQYKLNPIHGADLAEMILDSRDLANSQIEVGGPDILTQDEIANLALDAFNNPGKTIHLPDWTRRAIIWLARTFTSSKTYGSLEFFLTMMGQDNIGPRYGVHRLETFFKREAGVEGTQGLEENKET